MIIIMIIIMLAIRGMAYGSAALEVRLAHGPKTPDDEDASELLLLLLLLVVVVVVVL